MYNSFESISVKTKLKRPDCLKTDGKDRKEPLTFEQVKRKGYIGTFTESMKSFERLGFTE
jgi:hypothetical protein